MSDKKYWHMLSTKEQEGLLKSRMKLKDFIVEYSQPDWCSYPKALESLMGCWSLITPDKVREPGFCKDCECFIGGREK